MCTPGIQEQAGAITQAGGSGSSQVLTDRVRQTNIGKMVSGDNRQAYMEYNANAQMNGQQPLSYKQWLIVNRNAR